MYMYKCTNMCSYVSMRVGIDTLNFNEWIYY